MTAMSSNAPPATTPAIEKAGEIKTEATTVDVLDIEAKLVEDTAAFVIVATMNRVAVCVL
jgi:hypothetical protein